VKIVELRRRRPEDASVETLARIFVPEPGMPGQPAVIEPVNPAERDWVEYLISSGGVTNALGRALGVEDGEEFVAALPAALRGSRLWAEEVPGGDA
jgi:hypothetical protein